MNADQEFIDRLLNADFANIARKVKAGKTLTSAERKIVQEQRAKAEAEKAATKAKKNPTKPGSKKLGTAKNMTAAANLTALKEATVQAARDAGCPAFKANGNVNCDELLRYVSEHPDLLNEEEDAGELSKAREEVLRIRADRKMREHKLKVAKDKVISRAEIATRLQNVGMAQRQILEEHIQDEALLRKIYAPMRKLVEQWTV